MPQLRQDLVTGRWVTIATERARRPTAFTRAAAVAVKPAAQCPFCEGHEKMTPPEVMAYRAPRTDPDTPGWEFRVVPNLYPAFGPADLQPEPQQVGIYTTRPGSGVHEVLIHSPNHYHDLADLPVDQVEMVVRGYVDRYLAVSSNPIVQYVLLILNHGKEAGASLEHPHSQLFGVPLLPPTVAEEIAGVARYRSEQHHCPFCDMLEHERLAGERIIHADEHFVAFAPYASRTPFEAWVVPTRHNPRFETIDPAGRRGLASSLRTVLGKLSRGLNDPPFNLWLHTSPARDGSADYHWHVEILPKLAIAAGFELGTGIMIDVVTPESAAEFLRGVDENAPSPVPAPSVGTHA